MEIRLDGQRALVTGASSGIGEAVALAFGAAGARVAVGHLAQEDAARAVAEKVRAAGGEAVTAGGDIASREDVAALFAQIDEAWGGLDILVANAGMDGARATAWESDPDEWRRVIDVNLFGTYLCAREALSRMVPQRSGVILNISSVHERIAWGGYSAYAAAKAGGSMLSKTLALESAASGVRVLALAPGAIRTDINRAVWEDPAMLEDLHGKIPMARMGRVEEIAAMALVLVSGAGSYMTGTTVFVDGGMLDYPDFAHGG